MSKSDLDSKLDNIRQYLNACDGETNTVSRNDETISKICDFINSVVKDKELELNSQICYLLKISQQLENCVETTKTNPVILSLTSFNNCLSSLLLVLEFCKEFENAPELESTTNFSNLFQSTYQNLKGLTNLLDIFIDYDQTQSPQMSKVTSSLIECSVILCTFDSMACVPIWKQLKKFITQNQSEMLNEDNPTVLFAFFKSCTISCHALNQWFHCIQKGDIPASLKLAKVVKFMLTMVMQIVMSFGCKVGQEESKLVFDILVFIQRFLIEEDVELEEPLHTEYLKVTESLSPIISPLVSEAVKIPNALFGLKDSIATNSNYGSEDSKRLPFSYLSITNEILVTLSRCDDHQIFNQWLRISDGESIISFVFDSLVPLCEKKMFIGGTYYEQLLCKTCCFVASLPAEYFGHLEEVLLQNLVNTESRILSIFSADLWCFVSRWGSDQLCWNHFKFLGSLLLEFDCSNVASRTQISSLFQRLFWFLSSTTHESIVSTFPPSQRTVPVWTKLPVWDLSVKNRKDIIHKLCHEFDDVMSQDQDDDVAVIELVRCMVHLTSNEEFSTLDDKVKEQIIRPVVEFWLCFDQVADDIEMNEELVVSMLQLINNLFSFLDQTTFAQMLSLIRKVLLCIGSEAFQLQCCGTLATFKNVTFPDQIKSKCLGDITLMFNYLLTRESWLIQTYAMKALKDFAEVTVYSKSVSSFLPVKMKTEFTKFLRKQTVDMPMKDLYSNCYELLAAKSGNTDYKTGFCDEQIDTKSDIDRMADQAMTKVEKSVDALIAMNMPLNRTDQMQSWNNRIDRIIEKLRSVRR